jgi:hypothetical protein
MGALWVMGAVGTANCCGVVLLWSCCIACIWNRSGTQAIISILWLKILERNILCSCVWSVPETRTGQFEQPGRSLNISSPSHATQMKINSDHSCAWIFPFYLNTISNICHHKKKRNFITDWTLHKIKHHQVTLIYLHSNVQHQRIQKWHVVFCATRNCLACRQKKTSFYIQWLKRLRMPCLLITPGIQQISWSGHLTIVVT